MLEALSRFNVTARANIKRDINGASWPIWYGGKMGVKNTADRLRISVGGKIRRGRILFYTADMPYQCGKWNTLAQPFLGQTFPRAFAALSPFCVSLFLSLSFFSPFFF